VVVLLMSGFYYLVFQRSAPRHVVHCWCHVDHLLAVAPSCFSEAG
jgi:hypothetical protein